ncbi:ergothioneine biosynthesis glutamate--cysteine ligase EgtA [Streptomyces sp. NPDC098781]|uniref:ergothioneine biosynthesis glutamate--cysteine ligase EgtA n=1 Tax=Streptomyces sp. NPDC098781 TaxID=3366097 RepID=UPI00381E99AC
MSDEDRLMNEAEAESLVGRSAFSLASPQLVGVELEWLVHDTFNTALPVSPQRVSSAIGSLKLSGFRSIEPGGQLELSSLPGSLENCVTRSVSDMSAIRSRLAVENLMLAGRGMDLERSPHRHLDLPRYEAMQRSFDRANTSGRWMLYSTASVQVSLDAGDERSSDHGYRRRWEAAHALGPVLCAAFANSPIRHSRATGWRSTRQAEWFAIDPSRTEPPPIGRDPRVTWARYVLDAHVVCIRRGEGAPWTAPADLTFRDWVRHRRPRVPTIGDLRYHMSTLFPPVRPRGHLEFRMIDAQPGDDWIVPLAVVKALLDDSKALDAALCAVEAVWRGSERPIDLWIRSARDGLADPGLAEAALVCFEAAQAALCRSSASSLIIKYVESFVERYVSRGRSPADDLLAAFEQGVLPRC